jgi:hypothetical protein
MGESRTRRKWRARVKALAGLVLAYGVSEKNIEEWLDKLMQTPELELAEKADSTPNYRLAVVDAKDKPRAEADFGGWRVGVEHGNEYRRVVKMEGE